MDPDTQHARIGEALIRCQVALDAAKRAHEGMRTLTQTMKRAANPAHLAMLEHRHLELHGDLRRAAEDLGVANRKLLSLLSARS